MDTVDIQIYMTLQVSFDSNISFIEEWYQEYYAKVSVTSDIKNIKYYYCIKLNWQLHKNTLKLFIFFAFYTRSDTRGEIVREGDCLEAIRYFCNN